ncbi:MAG: hypothetical protein ACKVJQ_09475 [Alphaproteobacteria bacterium]
MIAAWRHYREPDTSMSLTLAEDTGRRQAFKTLRDTIADIVHHLEPKTITCLGAGVLNDIPYRDMLQNGTEITLVDWFPNRVEHGIKHSLIQNNENGKPNCAYCALDPKVAKAYCHNFTNTENNPTDVCTRYLGDASGKAVCTTFKQGTEPTILDGDVTQGFATAFAAQITEKIKTFKGWRQAIKGATHLAHQIKDKKSTLEIPDSSMDFVTSSMLVSQFEHEPYDLFSNRSHIQLGEPTPRDERRLAAPMEKLRSDLFATQFERHCDEISRILRPEGHCFMAFELFHRNIDNEWFLVPEILDTLANITGTLAFDFDLLPPDQGMIRLNPINRPSMIMCMILKPALKTTN